MCVYGNVMSHEKIKRRTERKEFFLKKYLSRVKEQCTENKIVQFSKCQAVCMIFTWVNYENFLCFNNFDNLYELGQEDKNRKYK